MHPRSVLLDALRHRSCLRSSLLSEGGQLWAAPSGAQECTDQLNIGLPQPLDPVMVTGDPAYERPGTGMSASPDLDIGLCGAFRSPAMSNDFANPPSDVRLAPSVVPDSINAFMDRAVGAPRVHANLTTPFDLANFIDDMGQNSYGDYITTAQCKPATPPSLTTWQGCGFPGSGGANLRLGFGSRFRGFLNVKAEWVGKQLHFWLLHRRHPGVRIFWKIPSTNPVQYQVGWVISRGTARESRRLSPPTAWCSPSLVFIPSRSCMAAMAAQPSQNSGS